MYQKDYILRMLEMLAEMIGAIMSLISKGKYGPATKALENAYQTLLKEDASFFQIIPTNKLTEKLLQEHHYTNGHLEIPAELFLAEAELQFSQGKKEKSIELYEKSLVLFEFLEKERKTYSDPGSSKIDSIKGKIKEILEK